MKLRTTTIVVALTLATINSCAIAKGQYDAIPRSTGLRVSLLCVLKYYNPIHILHVHIYCYSLIPLPSPHYPYTIINEDAA